jgi:hypothetical protein
MKARFIIPGLLFFSFVVASYGQTYSVRTDTLLFMDDGSAETGWGINPGIKGWLGNYFPVSSSLSGYIDTIDVWFYNNPGGTNQLLTIDVFDQGHTLSGSTPTFSAMQGSWLSVPAPNISFTGPFYLMVKWNHLPAASHFLGYDDNGQHASQNDGRYCDSIGNWTTLVEAGGALPGVFLLRARASTYPLSISGNSHNELPLVYPNPADDKVVVSMHEEIRDVRIFSSTGVLVREQFSKGEKLEVIDLSSLPEGLYLISVNSKSGTSTGKILIQH